ncbi:4-hydroxyphenylacetate decarboxylase large subunit [Clostridium diolis]|uniref:4-hydroxyphenylacetate decarboxylase large subunit n=1 Tax=Clostridium diolis TaxID=223919 RepID=A0AAV3W5T8_9CLOT|nr:4-hydroxyphenylacetate decarboxylase large subunit [Clostridium diolis]QES73416.1 4-hydroxyphenylacetate decarboxylase large subunit [Clostridium diolis]GEA33678.1 4-hydroxyphenylacetate decarboxylase large subunit [Clostridium diolis]
MNSNETKLEEVLKMRGINMNDVVDTKEYKIPEAKDSTKRLMEIYYNLKVTADMEAPYWYNRAWSENEGDVTIVRRAKAMAACLSHITPTILPYEKLVMNKTKNVRGAFPFPWVCASFFNAQAEALMNEVDAPSESEADSVSVVGSGGGNVTESYGEVISLAKKFGMRKEEIPVLVKTSKPWDGKSIEDLSAKYAKYTPGYDQEQLIMDSVICMFDSWAIPQGREVMNYYMPLEYGFDKIIELCDEKIEELMGEAGDDGILGMSRGYYYIAMKEITKGLSAWCENYSKQAEYLSSIETDSDLKANYDKIAEVMSNIAHKKPANFWEAIQMTLCCHYGVVNEDPQSGTSMGRLGQILQPYYEKDIEDGSMTDEDVIELLELYRIKITCIECFASAGVSGGVLSGNTFNNLSLGGQNYNGLSAVTKLEYLIIEAGMRNQTPQPTLSILYDEKTPEDFLMKAASCTKLGLGYPAWMNNQAGMNFMLRNYGSEGMDIVDARAWCLGGCLESAPGCFMPLHYNGKVTMIPGGASPSCATGIHFVALPKILELVLTNGLDNRTDKQVYPAHNRKIDSYETMMDQWQKYVELSTDVLNRVNNIQMDIWRTKNMPVVNSLLKPDCFTKGIDIGMMGSRYNASINFESCGTITLINSLASIKKNIFDGKKFTIEEMTDAMVNNFGFETAYETGVFSPDTRISTENSTKYDKIFAACLNAPKYGNADMYVDSILRDYEYYMYDMTRKFKSYYGKPEYLCQISVSTHGPQGFITLATADGRLAGTTYSDGSLSAASGTDKNGIYAIFESATVYDHSMQQNSQMNLKLHPTAVKGLNGTRKLLEIVRAYMRKGGFHVQFNVVDSKTLRNAQAKPDNYRDLMVRVAGFTQYWCEIGKPIQDEVIYRTEYEV